MSDRTYTVYKHTSPSGKVYIGITGRTPEERWNNGHGYSHCTCFYYAIKKYRWDNIQHEIISTGLTKEQAEQMEIDLIAKYRSNQREFGYNILSGGDVSSGHTEETKNKISSTLRKEHARAKTVICDNEEYHCLREFCEVKNQNYGTVKGWLQLKNPMPIEWYVLGLRYKDVPMCKYRERLLKPKINPSANAIVCEGLEFKSAKDCGMFYNEKPSNINNWLSGRKKMPKKWYDMGLRYRDKDNSCIRPMAENIGDNNSKKIFCNNIIFDSIVKCAEYYNVNPTTMGAWLNPNCIGRIPQKFINLGLRYATNEDVLKYPSYKNVK